ncbi:MAG: GTP 3',8-cyclase MoaA [Planctomycetota bacterium]|nr:GTP 3',8-cyclase MoaA [Planctomycetota bacterium]
MTTPLIDSLGRVHSNLRVSVTDRCNIRCFYCMPDENVRFKPREEILTFEEIEKLVRVAASRGVTKLRITGGEPLVRAELPTLVGRLAAITGIEDIALTTNGILLAAQAEALCQAGLQRLNISLDGLRDETFEQIARRPGLADVLEGIRVAQQLPFEKIRLNAVAISGISEEEIVPLGSFAREENLELRFIEFMPLDAEGNWKTEQVLEGDIIRAMLEEAFGPLQPAERHDPSQPAVDYTFADGIGNIGFINPVSQPFCADCNRLRVTAEGQLRNCLFSHEEWDVRELMRQGGSDEQISQMLTRCVAAKKPGHGIDSPDFQQPERAMFQIGG